jgi:phosphopantothenoylcysteine decarboxylase / phosphopantothenate---cysteine ligase
MGPDDQRPRVLLGVSGGIAAYKACELASRLTQDGAEVRVVMTANARQFVAPLTLAALTGQPVFGEMFDPAREAAIGHIDLARWAGAVALVPATANLIAKAAMGLADDLLSTILLATRAPLLIAPAMNPAMWVHPTVAENLARLKARGAYVVEPGVGNTACGEQGQGRLAEVGMIAEGIWTLLTPRDLAGARVLVTGGPTREHLDPVRFISNPSSGRMGIAIAAMAARRGAKATLVLGPTHLEAPPHVRTIRVTSAQEMLDAVLAEAGQADVVVKAAAVGDFRPAACQAAKAKKDGRAQTCELLPTIDILATLGRDKGNRILVGFAAETHDLLKNATAKLRGKNLDLMVANDVSAAESGFAVPTNRVHFLFPDGRVEALPLLSKLEVAARILDQVAILLGRT